MICSAVRLARVRAWIAQKDMDLAASIQKVCEETVFRVARHAHKQTGMRNLTMAGVVASIGVANGRVLRDTGHTTGSGCSHLPVMPEAPWVRLAWSGIRYLIALGA